MEMRFAIKWSQRYWRGKTEEGAFYMALAAFVRCHTIGDLCIWTSGRRLGGYDQDVAGSRPAFLVDHA